MTHWLKRLACRIFGHKYEDRIAIRWFPIGEVLVWEPVDVEICSRCGEFRRYDWPPLPTYEHTRGHVNCRCTGITINEYVEALSTMRYTALDSPSFPQ